ncbi:MAG: hypothetical protein KJO54_13325, partial [Gammaproteobacteria bacterium]|nr:hypothetical protein [Gammaproteobacteria bacterium]
LGLSSAVHVIAFVAVALFVTFEFDPSIYTRLLTVSIQPTLSEEGLEKRERVSVASAPAVVPEKSVAQSPPEPATASPSQPAPPPARPARQQPASVRPAVRQAVRQAAAAPAPVQAEAIVTTTGASDAEVPGAPPEPVAEPVAKFALAARERRMLEQRIDKLQDQIARMPPDLQQVSWKHRGQEYTARIRRDDIRGNTEIERVTVEVSKLEDGSHMTTELTMRRLAFSNFTQFVGRWDPQVQIHRDEMDGRFHSNTSINLLSSRDGRPRFHGKVSVAARGVNLDSEGRVHHDDIFLGGLETGVKAIRLPDRFLPFPEDRHVDEGLIHRLTSDTRIRFHADGTYGWSRAGRDSFEERRDIGDEIYLLAGRRARLYVSGTVRGRVLVYSPRKVVIEGDLVYSRHPERFADSDDFLGLVSDRDVEIAAADVTGEGDLTIHGSIYARGRFAVRGYRRGPDGLLAIYGSISAGTVSATEPRFRTRISFDKRLEHMRPPGFPMTSRYEVTSWDREWVARPTAH